ncbi:MAG: hypothetical protein JTT11_05640, partial [Candidatus Brockarchaeota archaeon]|nr:hypothetical protein [Candidatus Brockarchaeota archaeon]
SIPAFELKDLDFLYFGTFIASAVPLILVSLLPASPLVGGLLLVLFVYYTFNVIFRKGAEIPTPELRKKAVESKRGKAAFLAAAAFLGAIGVVLSAHFLVDSTVDVAVTLGVPASLVSATIVAVGTSLPELVLDLQAILKGETGLALGDIIGSNFTNITLILGVTLSLSPINIDIKVFSDLATFSILANIILWYLLLRGRFGRAEGLCLLSLYALFLASILGLLTFG